MVHSIPWLTIALLFIVCFGFMTGGAGAGGDDGVMADDTEDDDTDDSDDSGDDDDDDTDDDDVAIVDDTTVTPPVVAPVVPPVTEPAKPKPVAVASDLFTADEQAVIDDWCDPTSANFNIPRAMAETVKRTMAKQQEVAAATDVYLEEAAAQFPQFRSSRIRQLLTVMPPAVAATREGVETAIMQAAINEARETGESAFDVMERWKTVAASGTPAKPKAPPRAPQAANLRVPIGGGGNSPRKPGPQSYQDKIDTLFPK